MSSATIMFVDVVGFSKRRPDEQSLILDQMNDVAQRTLGMLLEAEPSGIIAMPTGDGFALAFMESGEDRWNRSTLFTVIYELQKWAQSESTPEKPLSLRIGVHEGSITTTTDISGRQNISGHSVNSAQRVMDAANPKQVLFSDVAFQKHVGQDETSYTSPPFSEDFKAEFSRPVEVVGKHDQRILVHKMITSPPQDWWSSEDPQSKAPVKETRTPLTKAKLANRLDTAKVVIMGLLVIVGAAELWHAYTKTDHPPKVEVASLQKMAFPLPDKPSIAVLSFDNLTGDPEQEYFTDGFTEQIITSLAKSSSLFVIARNSSFAYKGKPVKIQQVSEDLGVRYVLEGSIQRSGDRVRINAQLVDAVSGEHLWSERYDRGVEDIFALQDEINMKILTALQIKLTTGEQARAWARGTKNLDAYLKLMQARENLYQINAESNTRARQLIEDAIALDPEYAEAYALMGATHYLDVWLGLSKSPKDSLMQAIDWNKKALAIDDSLAVAYARLGYLYVITPPNRYEEGIAALKKAVAMDPNAALSHHFLGMALRFAGRSEEAIPMTRMAIRLEPFTPGIYYQNLGLEYLLEGDCEEAIKACEKGLERERDNLMSNVITTAVYGSCGKEEKAKNTAKEVLRLSPKFTSQAFSKKLPYKFPKDRELVLDGLRKAGL